MSVIGGAMQLHPWPQQSDPDRQRKPASLCPNSPAAAQHLMVVAELGYLMPTEARPYQYAYEPPDGTPWQNCEYETRAMHVTDARFVSASPSVHIEGFELWDAPSAVTDFADDKAIVKTYYA